VSTVAPTTMTADEYLAWERVQVERHEYYYGQVFAMSGGSERHAALGAALIMQLGAAFRGGPCRVYSNDLRIATMIGSHYVYPDVSVLCAPRQVQPGTTDVTCNPSVVVEVLSATTEKYDRGEKWTAYQRLASLTDFLLVAQGSARIEHYQRSGGESWTFRVWGPGDRVVLSNGASFEVDAVYAGAFELEGDPPSPPPVQQSGG
jgi:Uma2 family endonuclease